MSASAQPHIGVEEGEEALEALVALKSAVST
jgi:hypothetical protein